MCSLTPMKLDLLMDEFNVRSLDILLLCETWHDSNSVVINRLRTDGYTVVERARPCRNEASLRTNYGGVAVVAASGIGLVGIRVGTIPTTFECVVARVTSKQSSCVVVVIYRPGSSAVNATFYTELSQVLDQLVTMTDSLILAGDINIRLERVSDRNTQVFTGLMLDYWLVQHVCGATHRDGGTLDLVCNRDDQPVPAVDVCNFGDISDHSLLCWTSCLQRTPPVYTTSRRRSWRAFNRDVFKSDLPASPLCDQTCWSQLDGDELSRLYDDTITSLLDKQIPICVRTSQRRPSNAWFDDDCRQAKRLVRSKERTYRRMVPG